MNAQNIKNKFIYSYYSVIISGGLITFLLHIISSILLQSFNLVFAILLTITLFFMISNISLIYHEGFGLRRLMGVFIFFFNLILFAFPFTNLLYDYFSSLILGFLIMNYYVIHRKPKYNNDYIIILGCSISKTGGLLPLLKGRANRAIHFAWEQEIATGKPLYYVPSGGQGPDEIMSEGSALELYLLSHGAEPFEVFPEKKSRNTYENLFFSKQIIDKIKSDAVISYCTTNYHVFRSGILASRLGLNAQGIASKTKWYFWPNALIREFIAFLTMFPYHHLLVFGFMLCIYVFC